MSFGILTGPRRIRAVAVLCATMFLALGLLTACTPPLPPANGQTGLPIVNPSPVPGSTLPALHIQTANGGDVVVYVEVATTPEQHQRGLMGRTSMPADQGMVFDFGGETQTSFWMKDTLIPLSIAWFTHDGVIVDIQEMEALSEALHTPRAPYWYALEANKGFFAAHGVQPGDTVRWPPK
jgi:uncharacterized membrane protein (UPF0127 family)